MQHNSDVVIYAGNSLSRKSKSLIDTEESLSLMPPIQRNDLTTLYERGFRGMVVLVDGRNSGIPAVGHDELYRLLMEGMPVFGLSAIGAIRAIEMEAFGMEGYGKVFSYYKNNNGFQDDEVLSITTAHPHIKLRANH